MPPHLPSPFVQPVLVDLRSRVAEQRGKPTVAEVLPREPGECTGPDGLNQEVADVVQLHAGNNLVLGGSNRIDVLDAPLELDFVVGSLLVHLEASAASTVGPAANAADQVVELEEVVAVEHHAGKVGDQVLSILGRCHGTDAQEGLPGEGFEQDQARVGNTRSELEQRSDDGVAHLAFVVVADGGDEVRRCCVPGEARMGGDPGGRDPSFREKGETAPEFLVELGHRVSPIDAVDGATVRNRTTRGATRPTTCFALDRPSAVPRHLQLVPDLRPDLRLVAGHRVAVPGRRVRVVHP